MLTTMEANFVTEYKISGNATQALKQAGYKFSSASSARIKACRLLKKPEIIETLVNHQTKLVKQLETPHVTTIAPAKVITLPSKEEFASVAWKRSSDESQLKEDTKHKYFETAGKVLRYIGPNENESRNENVFNIICAELKLTNTENILNQIALEKKSILESMNAQTPQQSSAESHSQNIVDVNNKKSSHE